MVKIATNPAPERDSHAEANGSRLVFFGDSFVFDRISGNFHRINATAAFILRAIENGISTADLPELVQSQYGIDHASAVRDAELFLDELYMLGFLEGDQS